MDLNVLFSPKSIAMIGASNREGSLGYQMVDMIKRSGFKGEVYPVNPRYDEILGIKTYPSLESIGKPVDLVVLSVSVKRVLEQIDIAIANKARALVIFANCVLEEDPNLEDKVVEKCKKAGIPVLGHNAMGYYNNDIDLRVCGFEAPDEGVKGNIALISQSGSVFSTIGHNEPQLKYNLMVATGTGHITSLSDCMIHALNMPTTKVLAVYMESVRKPEQFIKALKLAAEKRIPITLMKVGNSELGAQFALSHTGGLAGNDETFQAICDHYGVVRANSMQEWANTMALFSYYPKILKGGLVAIADSGGERNLLADDAEFVGLEYAKLSDSTMKKLAARQEYGQEAANPLDPWGTGIDFDIIFADSMEIMLNDENAAIGVISQDLRDEYFLSNGCLFAIEEVNKRVDKPIVHMTNFGGMRREKLTNAINATNSPVLVGTRESLLSIKNYLGYRDFKFKEEFNLDKALSKEIIDLFKTKDALNESESMSVLDYFGFPVEQSIKISSLESIEKNKNNYKYPLVLKTSEEGILHKADVGGVRLNINSYEELVSEYKDMSNKLGEKAIIVKMVEFESEFILGMKTDPIFGPMIIVGAGGILTELIKDTIVILPQTSKEEIKEKIKSLKSYQLLTGFRGKKPVNIDKFVDLIKLFCEICDSCSEYVGEIDINPVTLNGDQIVALDALIINK